MVLFILLIIVGISFR
ncbi:hypothetical protein COE25_22700 [Bacillus sp. AFS031507]|nr:hypothetical protein COE25_22700 [Bacillus sp. AFS031507]